MKEHIWYSEARTTKYREPRASDMDGGGKDDWKGKSTGKAGKEGKGKGAKTWNAWRCLLLRQKRLRRTLHLDGLGLRQ